jgi:peptidoglycan/LPS O-acetylase OafA/YrhL
MAMRKIPPYLMMDAWRGIASLWVLMVHASVPFVNREGRFIHFPIYAVSVFGQLGVTMFFVISGYCIMGAAHGVLASDRSTASYGMNRLRRIYPPYLAACLFAVCFYFLIAFGQSHHLIPVSNYEANHPLTREPNFWLGNLLLIQIELAQPPLLGVSWSLCYEVVFYALLGLLLIIAKAHARRSPAASTTTVFQIGISALTYTSLAWLMVSSKTCPFPLDLWYQFGLGALLFLVFAAQAGSPAWRSRTLLIAAGLLLALFAALHPGHSTLGHPSSRLQAVTSLVFVALLWALQPFDANLAHRSILRPFLWLGTISYSVYLSHLVVMPIPDILGRRLGFDHQRYWVTYLVEIATSIIVGWLFYFFIERHFISSRQKQRIAVELRT